MDIRNGNYDSVFTQQPPLTVRVCIAYIAVSKGPIVDEYCSRFVATYREYPPGIDNVDLLVICNGGPLNTVTSMIFSDMDAKMFPRQNDGGWDVSAFQDAAKGPCAEYDAMLCLGESNYFHRAGWLRRLVEAWGRYGPGMYGPYSSNAVCGHLNTTAFMCAPSLFKLYPEVVRDHPARFAFEHGPRALWRRAAARKLPVRMVTWDGEWEPRMWRIPKNIIWRGDQTNCLMFCNHTDGYANLDEKQKEHWRRHWDQPFK